MKKNTICFVAGRSGGHLIPALTLARQEKEKKPNTKILFFSTATTLDKKITYGAQEIDVHVPLSLENIPYKKFYRFPIFFWNFFRSFATALRQLRTHKPDKIVSTGGYISLPIFFAAQCLKIPRHLYELNAVPGKTTKFLAPLAHTIHICFASAEKYFPKNKCAFTPYPNRFVKKIFKKRDKIFEELDFFPTKKTILVLGGSQGSVFLNKTVGQWIAHSPELQNRIQVIHQTGATDKTDWAQEYKKLHVPALVFDFCNNVEDYYQIADLVICRSGAGSLFETLFFKKQCITVPLETKQNDHQLHNALGMQQMHPELFTVVRQNEVLEKVSIFCKKLL